jgi:hypothetical protein
MRYIANWASDNHARNLVGFLCDMHGATCTDPLLGQQVEWYIVELWCQLVYSTLPLLHFAYTLYCELLIMLCAIPISIMLLFGMVQHVDNLHVLGCMAHVKST